MLLGVLDRLALPTVLPVQFSAKRMVVMRSIQEKVKFTGDEKAEFEIKEDEAGNNVVWTVAKDREVEISFTPVETALIVTQLAGLNEKEHLTVQTFPLHEKFVGNGKEM